MSDRVLVQVHGPSLLRRGICAVLAAFPQVWAPCDHDSGHGIAAATAVHLFVGQDWHERMQRLRSAAAAQTGGPAALIAVLVTNGAGDTLREAAWLGVTGFVAEEDAPEVLAGALAATAREGAFYSPRLFADLTRLVAGNGMAAAQGREACDDGPAALTCRERETVLCALRGLSDKEIAGEMSVCVQTVKQHLHHAYEKLGVRRRGQLRFAVPASWAAQATGAAANAGKPHPTIRKLQKL